MPAPTDQETYDLLHRGGRTEEENRAYLLEVQSQLVYCPDETCVDEQGRRSIAEPEQDETHLYYACCTCGYEFGWEKAPLRSQDPSCQMGIPEAVRRANSGFLGQVKDKIAANPDVLLQIGKRPPTK